IEGDTVAYTAEIFQPYRQRWNNGSFGGYDPNRKIVIIPIVVLILSRNRQCCQTKTNPGQQAES
ncbi:MAG: hypothetical protein K2G00_07220, partial [Duncaniella sp.]|nr:hypothetical protein [Duncaniella sp.]